MSVDLEKQVRRIIEKMGVEGAAQPVGEPFNPIGDLQSKLGATRMELRDLKGTVEYMEGRLRRLEAQ